MGWSTVLKHRRCLLTKLRATTFSISFHSNSGCTSKLSVASWQGLQVSGCTKLNDAEWRLLGLSTGRVQYYMKPMCGKCPPLNGKPESPSKPGKTENPSKPKKPPIKPKNTEK